MTLKDEAFILSLNEGKAARNAGEDGAHAASDSLLESLDEREFFLVQRGIFGNGKDDLGRVPFLQLVGGVTDEESIAGNRQAVFGIEVCKVYKLAYELVAQARVGKNLPVTVALVSLHECRDK